MKKNKTVAYLLAASLLVGGTFVGTKALLTHTDKVESKIQMQFETDKKLNIFTEIVDQWKLWKEGGSNYIEDATWNPNNNDYGENYVFKKAKAGTEFRKSLKIANNSDVDVDLDVKIDLDNIPEGLENVFSAKATYQNGNRILKGSSKIVNVEVMINDTEDARKQINKFIETGATVELDTLFNITVTEAKAN